MYYYDSPTDLKKNLRYILAISLLLTLLGLLFVYGSSAVHALELYNDSYFFLKKQLLGIFLGISCIIALQCISVRLIEKYTPLFFLGTLFLTGLTLVPGIGKRVHGSSRWLKIGITMQPSELLKIGLILMVAYLLANTINYRHRFLQGYGIVVLLLAVPSLILLKQPDFGMTICLAMTTFAMLFAADARLIHLGTTIFLAIPVVILLIVKKSYRLSRILTFLDPWRDPQGAGFQIIQSLIAIGSGNTLGVGIGNSHQKFFYLPMQHTDFIFSIIAEEIGFLSVGILLLYILFFYYCLHIIKSIRYPFIQLSILGFATTITFQAFINIAVATALIPTKGIGLPYISYGLSDLVSNLIMVGLIIAFVRHSITDQLQEIL